MSTRSLNCFYDLSIAPCSYDFFAFLISAELHRVRNSFSSINLIFLPGAESPYRLDNLRTFQQNDNFFKNVLMVGPLLYESCKGVIWLDKRSDAQMYLEKPDEIFPRGYSIDNPITDYAFHGIVSSYFRGEDPVFFQAPEYASNLAKSFLKQFSDKKHIITLTTRELTRDDPGCRKVNTNFWQHFFELIDKSKFQPLVIRDTSAAFNTTPMFEGIPEVPAASIHLHLRYAIYQSAHLNIFKPNGPSILSVYGTPATLFFFDSSDAHPSISLTWYKQHHGMSIGSQYPLSTQNKRIIWGSEDQNSIDKMLQKLDTMHAEDLKKLHPISDRNTLLYTTQIALSHTIQNMRFGVMDEDIKLLQDYKKLLMKRLFTGVDPLLVLREKEKLNILKKGTVDKVIEMDKRTDSVLIDRPLIYKTA